MEVTKQQKFKVIFDGVCVSALGVKRCDFVFDFLEPAFNLPTCGVILDHLLGRHIQISGQQRKDQVLPVNEDHFDFALQSFGHAGGLGKRTVAQLAVKMDFSSHCQPYSATMVGFPYDDIYTWTGANHYPEDIFEDQFRKLSEGWSEGLKILLGAETKIPAEKKDNFTDLLNVAEAAYCHFRSTYLQIRQVRIRQSGQDAELNNLLDEEIELAKRLLTVIKRDARIGFEASNHYYYTDNDLKEKVLNCENLKVPTD